MNITSKYILSRKLQSFLHYLGIKSKTKKSENQVGEATPLCSYLCLSLLSYTHTNKQTNKQTYTCMSGLPSYNIIPHNMHAT